MDKFQVSLFKKNFGHLPNDSNFELYRLATRGNPNYFLTYGNGKSAARIQDNLRPNGAHRWYNYVKEPKYVFISPTILYFFCFFWDYYTPSVPKYTIKSNYIKIISDYFNVISNHFKTKNIYWVSPIKIVSLRDFQPHLRISDIYVNIEIKYEQN